MLLEYQPIIAFLTVGVLSSNLVTCSVLKTNAIQEQESKPSEALCESPACVQVASYLLDAMDSNVQPCDDFYQFVCGNFAKKTILAEDQSYVDSFVMLRNKVKDQLRTSLQEKLADNEPRAFKLLQSYFDVCMNQTQIEKNGIKDFQNVLKKLGDWPVLATSSWDEKNFNWQQLMFKFHDTGYPFDYFVDVSVNVDAKNTSRSVIYVTQPRFGIDLQYLTAGLNDSLVQAYRKYIIELAVILGAKRDAAEKDMAESLNFEMELANLTLSDNGGDNQSAAYNPTTLKELSEKYPDFGWTSYISTLLAPYARVQPNELIIVNTPNFIDGVRKLISKTPKRVLANYAFSRIAQESVDTLSDQAQEVLFELQKLLTGEKVRRPRSTECVEFATDAIAIASGALYVRKFVDQSVKPAASEIFKKIRASFKKIIENEVDWMDDKTKKYALEKLANIFPHIAYPNEFFDDNKLNEYYQNLKTYPDSYLKTFLSVNLFKLSKQFDELRKPVNRTDWVYHSSVNVVNAFYNPTENSIEIHASILQGKFFEKDRPKFVNYGTMGFTMGHEMTHGFDNGGRQLDKDGNLVDWWAPDTLKKYNERAQCIIEQYGNYTVPEINTKVDGQLTLPENIADNGGIKEAYEAYSAWIKENGEEPRLPGLKYNSRQMFWISAASVWCSKLRPEAFKSFILTGSHSPDRFRVIGPMSNRPEFSKDFNCPVGSTMNPAKKCSVW